MKKILLLFVAMLSVSALLQAQLITVDPAFPSDQDQVVVVFNAQLGSGGLAGTSDDVYAHTGVITSSSTSPSDWKYVKAGWTENIPECQLSPVGEDLWQLTIGPSIRDYYGVPSGETILQLAFVFRNSDGSATGKTADGGDIFYDVSEGGIQVLITTPASRPTVVQLNDQIQISGSSSEADTNYIYVDNELIYTGTGNSFFAEYVAGSYGKHWVKAVASNTTASAADSMYVYVRQPAVVEERPEGIIDGINYLSDTSLILSLYAPEKEYIFAIGDFSDWELEEAYEMKITPDGKHFWTTISGLVPGQQYIYQYLIDGTIRVGDIYADQVSDPWNDQYITSATYPDLISYPTGKTTGIATVFQTAQEPYQWEVETFATPEPEKLVVYECLVRDFTTARTFNAIIDTLDYLQNLGITALELMPVSEFEGNISWGYNPNYYFAVDKYYGPKDTFKHLVDECHKRGIAVIMDMVLNHAYGTCPLAMMYWDGENNRPAANNPWFNVTSPNTTYSWGSDFNHESQATKDFVDRVNRYWMEEYKVDGFRFDFTKGFTNTPGDGWAYDQARIDILKRMSDAIWSVKDDALVLLEHLTANSEETVLANYGMYLWGNMNWNYCQISMGWDDNDISWISYDNRGWSKPNLVGYMESHDEERMMYKNYTWGNSSGVYNTQEEPTALKRVQAAAAFFFTVPGPKMIWQFEELGYDYSINTCENGTVSDACRLSPKPVKWSYYNDAQRKRVYDVFRALIDVKKSEPAFSTTDFTFGGNSSRFKTIHLNHADMNVTIIGNFDVESGTIVPAFQETGVWYDFFSSDSIQVTDVNAAIELAAGEFHIYTTKKLNQGTYLDVAEQPALSDALLQLAPNPAQHEVTVSSVDWSLNTIRLIDMGGREVMQWNAGGSQQMTLSLDQVPTGFYLMTSETTTGAVLHQKLIVR